VLARGSTARQTIDLRANYGAFLFPKIGRGGTAALSAGVVVRARRVLNADIAMAGGVHPVGTTLRGGVTAASATTVNVDSASGGAALNVASVAGFAAGDLICIQDSGGGVTRLEWHIVSKTAAGILTLDRNLQFTHTAVQADTVRNQSDVFAPVWVPGGSLIEVVFDYGSQTTGDSITIHCPAQQYVNEQIV
jgi:hypothetical protein